MLGVHLEKWSGFCRRAALISLPPALALSAQRAFYTRPSLLNWWQVSSGSEGEKLIGAGPCSD